MDVAPSNLPLLRPIHRLSPPLHHRLPYSLSIRSTLSSPAAAIAVRESNSSAPVLKRVSAESLQYESGFLGAVPERGGGGWREGEVSAMEYLTNILASRVYDVAVETPLDYAGKLSERFGVSVWLKREDLQPVFSFKVRGAYNMMAKLPKEQLEKGVICSSAGNHAQGVALAAKKLGCNAVIAMPVTTPEIKWKSVERLGATVVLIGDAYDEAQAYAKKRAEQEGRTFIPPFDHPDVIMGQGTVGMEIIRQIKDPLHAIFVPVGGGGLIAGIAAYIKRVSPE
ncbi:Threonine dehydratase 1 biosynthetic, chloroplastic-like protein, partial [Drosera capensis]